LKKILLIAFILVNLSAFGQDMIYLADGTRILGKIRQITADTIKYKNLPSPAEPIFTCPPAKLRFAFNAAGSYLVFDPAKPFTEQETDEFTGAAAKRRAFDIVVDLSGKLSVLATLYETETEISDGEDIKLSKDNLAFVIRKNGNHELFCTAQKALPHLINNKPKIDSLLAHPPEIEVNTERVGPDASQGVYVPPDLKWFGRKAFEKIQLFNYYLQAMNAVKNSGAGTDFIDRACSLFINAGLDSWVDALETKTSVKTKYKLRDYLSSIKIKPGQFSRVVIDNVNVDYYTRLRQGPDGNYYGTVTFGQNFSGFNDDNIIYRQQTKLNINIVVTPPHSGAGPYRKEMSGWDLYLDGVGIVETKK
jgi:hypothetical protein